MLCFGPHVFRIRIYLFVQRSVFSVQVSLLTGLGDSYGISEIETGSATPRQDPNLLY